jgi:hypothetical protein
VHGRQHIASHEFAVHCHTQAKVFLQSRLKSQQELIFQGTDNGHNYLSNS